MTSLESIKEKLVQAGKDLKGKYSSYKDGNVYRDLSRSLDAIDQIEKDSSDLEEKVQLGTVAIEGIRYLADPSKKKSNDDKSVQLLSRLYYRDENHGLVTRFVKNSYRRVLGKKYVNLKQGLKVIENTAQEIPAYTERLSVEISQRREDFISYRAQLRTDVENMILSKEPLERTIEEINKRIADLSTEYTSLEEVRLKNSKKGIPTDIGIITQINMLEQTISQGNEINNEYKTRRGMVDENIQIINNQISKIGMQLELLDRTYSVVERAKNFVDVHIPYALLQIRAQSSGIKTISGIDKVLGFISRQENVSLDLNQRISVATDLMDKKVKEVRQQVIESQSIYADGKNRLTDQTKEEPQKILTSYKERAKGFLSHEKNKE